MEEFKRARQLEVAGADIERARQMVKELADVGTQLGNITMLTFQSRAKMLRAYYVALKKEGFSSMAAFLIVLNTKI